MNQVEPRGEDLKYRKDIRILKFFGFRTARVFAAAFLIFSFVLSAAGAGNVYAAPSEWAAAEVKAAIDLGFVDDSLQDNYQSQITRAQFSRLAVMLYEKNFGIIGGTQSFEDTDDIYVGKAAYIGIVNGVSEGVFDPDGKLTREQAAAILTRLLKALNKPAPSVNPEFSDAKQVSTWAMKDVGTMQITGIMQGSGTKFDPKGSYSIEQSILTLLRAHYFKEVKETANLSDYYSYNAGEYAGVNLNFFKIKYSSGRFHPALLQANGALISEQSLKEMATKAGVAIAVNGTYFDAYSGNPVPSGTMIKNGKILKLSAKNASIAFKDDGTALIDRLDFKLRMYVNHSERSSLYPWTVNHQFDDKTATLLFTEEYPNEVKIENGAKGFLIDKNDKVIDILKASAKVPKGHSLLLINPAVVESYEKWSVVNIGDTLTLESKFIPENDAEELWTNIETAVSAGPLLVKNGKSAADPAKEGFTEAKILTEKAGRTFIGVDQNGDIVIGYTSATIDELTKACLALGLKDAMCLDGGWSTAIYADGKSIIEGRPVNNGLGFDFLK